jgi:hypothetical protein
MTIDEAREIPCPRGHSRHDAYVSKGKYLACRKCHRARIREQRALKPVPLLELDEPQEE